MSWWNNSYLFRRDLNITILDPIPAGHPAGVALPTAILLGLNKIRTDLADIVVVFHNDNDDSWIPLPTLAQIAGDEIQVLFNTLQDIQTTNNEDYFVYYGNKGLINVPTLNEFIFNPWPLTVSYLSSKVTYRHPDEDWTNGITTTINAKAAFLFSGVAVRLIAASGLSDGIASIQLDNQASVNVDFYQNGPEEFIPIYSLTDLSADYHVFRIINTGQRNASATDKRIAIDSFQYLGLIIVTDLGEEINTLNWTTNTGGNTS